MMNEERLSQLLKDTIDKKAQEAEPKEAMFTNICAEISKREAAHAKEMGTGKGKELFMFKRTMFKRAVAVCCAVICLASVAYAAVGYINTRGKEDFSFDTCPTQVELKAKAGFSPKYVEGFSNGYQFVAGMTGSEWDANDESNEAKTISMTYVNGASELEFGAEELKEGFAYIADENGEKVTLKNGVEGTYLTYLNCLRPENYELTEQEKAAEAAGSCVFSYGENATEDRQEQFIGWKDGNTAYYIYCSDKNLHFQELIDMANEVIAAP